MKGFCDQGELIYVYTPSFLIFSPQRIASLDCMSYNNNLPLGWLWPSITPLKGCDENMLWIGTWCIMESALPEILAVDKCMKKLIGLHLIFFLPSEGSLAPGFHFLGCFQDTAWFGSWSWREDMATAQSTSRYWFINGYVFESLICGELIWPFCFRVWSCRTRRAIQWKLGGWMRCLRGLWAAWSQPGVKPALG